MKKIRIALLLTLALVLSLLFVTSVCADGTSTTFPKAKSKAEKDLLTISEATVDTEDGAPRLRFSFAVDREALAKLEENARITFGALVGREANGFGKNTMKLTANAETGALEAPARAKMLTVYSTDGTRPVNAAFTSETLDAFTVTVDLATHTVERTESGIACLGFLIVEEENEDARVLYVARNGSPYGSTPSFAGVVREAYLSDKENDETMNDYIKLLQSQVKSDVDMLSETRVFFCGEDDESDLAEGERAIWVEYLPDRDPFPSSTDPDARAVRAAYIYYPISFDPSADLSESDLLEKGALRIFAYIGVPKTNDSVPGIVCVHGGGGHAYANYALEAVKRGFAAIAFDTEGCYNTTGREKGSYSEGGNAYNLDDGLSHKGKDSFNNAEEALTEQWLYYAVTDVALANSVLRALPEVDAEEVGITGISWGGLITTTSICYDHRFAFAIPVYISFHISESYGVSLASISEKPFADALWQDASLLQSSPVPTMIISSEKDLFASIDTVSKTVADLPNAIITVKPNLTHSQQHGASLPEIYYFAHHVLGNNGGFVTPVSAPTSALGHSYTLTLSIPEGIENVRATLYYRTEPLYKYGESNKPVFTPLPLTVAADGSVSVEIPKDARMYFIAFAGYSESAALAQESAPYFYANQYERGDLYSSTDIVYLP